ncbi:hypothetical protein E1301_Tti012385 [Triplophysa tibetana]|uniref:Uncharacterized protein n=1 Tax=Triplophysa tibetana TaxID=1572043 RepID=A0A5A9PGR2_9TELE|nr:hypothetical protein E1301_Tti012385 [Triplophysa tibetana]
MENKERPSKGLQATEKVSLFAEALRTSVRLARAFRSHPPVLSNLYPHTLFSVSMISRSHAPRDAPPKPFIRTIAAVQQLCPKRETKIGRRVGGLEGLISGLQWIHAFCKATAKTAVQFEAAAFRMRFYASASTSSLFS